MKHRIRGRKLGRNINQRSALYQGLITQLILHESLTTTVAKAKAVKPLAEKLTTKAKSKNLAARRLISSTITNQQAVNLLIHQIAPRYLKRPGGYLRIIHLGNRTGDNAPLARLEFLPAASQPLGKTTTPPAKPPTTSPKTPVKNSPSKKKTSPKKSSKKPSQSPKSTKSS